MKLKTFFIGLSASFGLPWLLVVAYPFYALTDKEAFEYEDKDGNAMLFAPREANHYGGELVYRAENCQNCHTQVIRNSFAGSEIFKSDWAGMKIFDEDGNEVVDTRRESISLDYKDSFASIGETRVGPDLMNYGMRIKAKVAKANLGNEDAIASGELKPFTAEELVYLHLYNPRHDSSTMSDGGQKDWSTCVSVSHLFDKVSSAGQGSPRALPVNTKEGIQIVPSAKAKALKNYLLGLDHDEILPEALNKGPKQ